MSSIYFVFKKNIYLLWLYHVLGMAGGTLELCWGMQTLSCGMRDLIPWLGIEPGPPVMRVQSLSH